MSCHAVNPRWLIHLPPTMSPPETSVREDWLERPEETFAFYGSKGITSLMLQEKHMGSRALVVLARTVEAAEKRFGIADGSSGVVLTRTQGCQLAMAMSSPIAIEKRTPRSIAARQRRV